MKNKRSFSQMSRSNKPSKQNKSATIITFLLVSDNCFAVHLPFSLNIPATKNIFRKYQSVWNTEKKLWQSRMQNYTNCLNQFKAIFRDSQSENNNTKLPMISIVKIPDFVFQAIQQMPLELQIKNNYLSTFQTIKYSQLEVNIDPKGLPFFHKLYDFQKQSLNFGIKKHGRILLADEMGVGKTLQSLAIACIYQHQWPFLIICPSSLRLNWQQQLVKWLPEYIKQQDIQVYTKGGTIIKQNIKALIISYDLAWRMKDSLQKYKIAIVDEAHYLKNSGNKRSDILTPFLSSRKRVLVLTGTPALAKPREIFNLISIVRPDVFYNFTDFGYRYCEPTMNPWSRTLQFNGCQHSKQLFYLLKDRVMIRRLKQDVLTQLPDKQRQKVIVQTDKSLMKEIKELLSGHCGSDDIKMQNLIVNMLSNFTSNDQDSSNKADAHQAISKAYSLTGMAKLQSIKQYILELLQNNNKLIVFAHHMAVLDGLQDAVKQKNFKYMRIDGSVSKEKRHQNVVNFQENPEIMVALLSITAAGVGLTLTASSTIIFAQLHWTPGIMIQAEDRAHRIGQKSAVNCHYLIGQKTLDTILYQYLQRKLKNVSSFIDDKFQNFEMQNIQKGQKGKISISKESTELPYKNKTSILFKFQSVKPVIDKYYSHNIQQSQISDSIHQSISDNESGVQSDIDRVKKYKREPYQIKEETSDQKRFSTQKKEENKTEKQVQQNFAQRQIKEVSDFIIENENQIWQLTQSLKKQSCESDQTL